MTRLVLLATVAAACGGCQHCYRVTDLSTGQTYYTHAWLPGMARPQASGVEFRDLATGDRVSIVNSTRVSRVSAAEARAATGKECD